MTPAALGHYGRGRSAPTPGVFVALARALGVATTDLAPLSERPTLTELRWHAGLEIEDVAAAYGDLGADYVGRILRGDAALTNPEQMGRALGVSAAAAQAAWSAARDNLTA